MPRFLGEARTKNVPWMLAVVRLSICLSVCRGTHLPSRHVTVYRVTEGYFADARCTSILRGTWYKLAAVFRF